MNQHYIWVKYGYGDPARIFHDNNLIVDDIKPLIKQRFPTLLSAVDPAYITLLSSSVSSDGKVILTHLQPWSPVPV